VTAWCSKRSALDTTGIGTVAGTAVVASANHLEPGWDPSVEAQVVSWLG
jgi:hypothetical protein